MARKHIPMPGKSWLSRVRFRFAMMNYGTGKLVAALVIVPCAILGLSLCAPLYASVLPVASAVALAVLTGIAIPTFILFGLSTVLIFAGVCAVVCVAEYLFAALELGAGESTMVVLVIAALLGAGVALFAVSQIVSCLVDRNRRKGKK